MAIRAIIKMGHPSLRVVSTPVEASELGNEPLKQLVNDLQDTMVANQGIGLAAPQINVLKRVVVIALPEKSPRYQYDAIAERHFVLINPEITILDKTLYEEIWEGCLSIPMLCGVVQRPRKILVNYITIDGEPRSYIAEDFLSVVFQHELDHLDGKLYVDRLSSTKQLSFEQEYLTYQLDKNNP